MLSIIPDIPSGMGHYLAVLPVLLVMCFTSVESSLQDLTYAIQEEAPRGTRVGNLAEDVLRIFGTYPLHPSSSGVAKPPVNLVITNWQDIGPQHFGIDTSSGYLVVIAKPDREALCPESAAPMMRRFSYPSENEIRRSSSDGGSSRGNRQLLPEKIYAPETSDKPCSLTVRVVYTPEPIEGITKDPILLTVNVIIADVNDHVPMFPQSRINLDLGESSATPGETTINLPTASDPDAGPNGTLAYWLEHNPGPHGPRPFNSTAFPFRLEGLVDGNPLRLRLKEPLDYEKVKSYEFSLCVEDMGTPNSLTSRLRIHINVLDENDNFPTFARSNYFIIINESLPRGSVLLDLQAHDLDSGQNGQVSFELPAPMTEEAKMMQQFFDVRTIASGYAKLFIRQSPDLDTGIEKTANSPSEISIRRSRDFMLRVIASDNGTPKRYSAEATVTVRVLDVNDGAPKIIVNFINLQVPPTSQHQQGSLFYRSPSPQKGYGAVMENQDRSLIAFATVQDLDSGPWGQVTCKTDNEAFKLVPIDRNVAEVESFDSHAVLEPRSANEELSFKLMTQKPFDREEKQQVNFRIICVDNAYKAGQTQTFVQDLSPPSLKENDLVEENGAKQFTMVTERAQQLTGTAMVSVQILDENDCVPEFTQSLYTFSEEENVPDYSKNPPTKSEGKAIGSIQARDRDLDPSLTYSLLTNPQDAFTIDSKTGTIYIKRPFDREAFLTSTYEGIDVQQSATTNESLVVAHFRAQVTDGKHTAETEIQVTITDVNDCPPIFEKTNYEFFVEENQRPLNGRTIGSVKAHDSDVGVNGQIVYRLQALLDTSISNSTNYPKNYNPERHFKIDPNTGSIHSLRPLDREQYGHHVFHVLAIDTSGSLPYHHGSGRAQFTATATATVVVNDENDNAPIITFPSPHTTLRLEVDAPAGQQVFTVTATDPDAAENGTVRYSLRQSTPMVAESRDGNEVANKGPIFSIDEQSGIVLLTEKLPSVPAKYLLTIGAHDLGGVVQRNTSIATIIQVVAKSQLESSISYKNNDRLASIGRGDFVKCPSEGCPPGGLRAPQPYHRSLGGTGRGGSQLLSNGSPLEPLSMPIPSSGDPQPFGFLTDRIIIFVLSSIFVVLLVVTVVLILLIRRRRFIEVNSDRDNKGGSRVSRIQNNISPRGEMDCQGNTLKLVRSGAGGGDGDGKTVIYRTGLSSDGVSHSDSEGRSIITTDTFPVGNGDDPYTLLKPFNRMQAGIASPSEIGYKTYNHCSPVNTFPTLIPMQNAVGTQGMNQNHPTVLYSTSDGYSDGFTHVYPVFTTTTRMGGRQSCPANNAAGLSTQPQKFLSNATYSKMPDSAADGSKCEYQLLLQKKMPVLIQHPPSNDQQTRETKLMGMGLHSEAWPSTSQETNNISSDKHNSSSMTNQREAHAFKSSTLQPMGRTSSPEWNSDTEDTANSSTAPLQPSQKVVKFSASSISLNKLTRDGLPKASESSYV